MSDIVTRFAALFNGREDAFGSEEGGCVRTHRSYAEVIDRHLTGVDPIGVYPLVPRTKWDRGAEPTLWEVKWGCVDLDVKKEGKRRYDYETPEEALVAARNLVTALRAMGITGWIERTRSGGYHVWVFAAEWVPASTMRRALLVACGLVAVPPTEVNPKSEGFDDPDTLGNYVRLPYNGGLTDHTSTLRVMIDVEHSAMAYPLERFLDAAENLATRSERLEDAAQLWVPPTRHETTLAFEGEVELDDALQRRLGGLAFTILTQGPLDGGDRSGALFKLAHCCKDDGLSAAEALAVITAADLAWGKYHARPDGERYLRRTVENAYR